MVHAFGAPISRDRAIAAWAWFRSAPHVVPMILSLALAVRLLMILAFPIDPRADSLWYLLRGREIAQGLGYQEAGFPTAFWPVGYHALLGSTIALFGPSMLGPLVLNLIAQLATITLIAWFARALGGGETTARVAALLYAIYPAHIVSTGDTAAEITSTAVAMAGMALLVKARGRIGLTLAAGLVLGLATLMRPQFLLFPPVVLGLMALTMAGFGLRRALGAAIVTAAGMMIVVLPWTARNMAVLHAPVMVSTNGGFALQAGANPLADGGYFQVEKSPLWADIGIPFGQRVERQVEIDARLKRTALRWIAANPARWSLLGIRKIGLLWSKDTEAFWALDATYPRLGSLWSMGKIVTQLYYLIVLAAGIAGFVYAGRDAWGRRPRSALLVAAAMPLFCSILAFGFTGQTRYHYPAMPFMMIAAGSLVARRLDGTATGRDGRGKIEPNTGGADVMLRDDGCTGATGDRSLCAQFEHSIGITEDGCEIFTRAAAD